MISKLEFENSLQMPLPFWQSKSMDEVCDLLGNTVAQMVGFAQNNPHHCYDLFLHTLHTVDEIRPSYSTILRVAAFFHDIGKPSVAFEKQGRLVFYGHAKKSAELAAPILVKLGYPSQDVDLICFYISHHDDFISWVLPTEEYNRQNPYLKEITLENVKAHIQKTTVDDPILQHLDAKDIWLNLIELCRADASAQAEFVIINDQVIDSKDHKVQKTDRIREEILKIFT